MRTADLLAGLHRIEESPWGEWYGKPLSAHGLSRLLRSYRIRTMPIRVAGEPARGYKREQFADAVAQVGVPGVTGVTGVTSQAWSEAGSNASNACNAEDANDDASPELTLYDELRAAGVSEREARMQAVALGEDSFDR
jgi:hypothetical protein